MGRPGGYGGGGGGGQQVPVLTDDQIREIMQGNINLLVSQAERLGKRLKDNKLTTSQIRSVYGMVKKMEMQGYEKSKADLILLKPKLAYAANRKDTSVGVKELRTVLTMGVDAVKDETSFELFVSFFEAILAYHRAAGGK